jgi:hypothetical protein
MIPTLDFLASCVLSGVTILMAEGDVAGFLDRAALLEKESR